MRPLLQILLLTLYMSLWVDPQGPDFSLPTPSVRQALALANYLMRRPIGPRSIRRDCRLLPQPELDAIFDAIRSAKRDTRLRPNVHDAFSFLHSHPQINAGAHGGAGFLPWHRVYLFLYEKMLRMYEPTMSLCYWDSTLEPDEASESTTFTNALFGSGTGPVQGGPGHGWSTPVGVLTRDLAVGGRPMNMADIEMILSRRTMGEISFPNGEITSNAEELHNHVHVYVGGHMGQIETAAYDPIFWFHHAFMDCIYEWFRDEQRRGGSVNVERDWPRDWGERDHAPFRPMRLGSLRNIDGQNEFFSRRVFRCVRVGRCRSNRDCGDHMTCAPRSSRCVSRTGATQSRSFFQNLFGMFGNSRAVGNLGNLGNIFGGNARGFSSNNGGMPGGFGGFGSGGPGGPPGGFSTNNGGMPSGFGGFGSGGFGSGGFGSGGPGGPPGGFGSGGQPGGFGLGGPPGGFGSGGQPGGFGLGGQPGRFGAGGPPGGFGAGGPPGGFGAGGPPGGFGAGGPPGGFGAGGPPGGFGAGGPPGGFGIGKK